MPHALSRSVDKILNSIPQVVWSAGRDGVPDFFSDQWFELHGGSSEDLMNSGWLKFVHPGDLPHFHAARKAVRIRPEPWGVKLRILHNDGAYRWASLRARPELDAAGRLERWYGTCIDIHDAVVAEESLRESEALYRSILEASADCIKLIDPAGQLRFINEPGRSLLEIDETADLIGSDWLQSWPLEARPVVGDAIKTAQSGVRSRFSAFCPTAKGTPKWWDVILSPIPDAAGEIAKILAVSRDVTSQVAKAEQLRWASEHDSLTSLPNRRAFEARLAEALKTARRKRKSVGLLLLDLDHFKHINDSLGHDAGDLLLKKFTQKLGESVRVNDYVARLGGDEFAIILDNVPGTHSLLEVGKAITDRLNVPLDLSGHTVSVGASIGGAIFPTDGANTRELVKAADTALYALKAEGRGGTKLFLPQFRSEAQQAASQLNLGRTLITAETVEPVYQPKVDLNTLQTVGYEALLRWHHPTFGIQTPETVAESFRNFEVSTKIACLMHNAVLSDLAHGRLTLERGQRVALNASPSEFLRDDYAETLISRIRHHGLDGRLFEIEVTEQALAERHAAFITRALAQLKGAGLHVSLDDFGTGQSSLSHLRDFPVDAIKIDRSFVDQICTDEGVRAIVDAVLSLGRSLNIEVVAEGVETEQHRQQLQRMGCRIGQGFLLGMPGPARSFFENTAAA